MMLLLLLRLILDMDIVAYHLVLQERHCDERDVGQKC